MSQSGSSCSPMASGSTGSSSRDGRIEIGATVTMAEIALHPALAFLQPVALSIGGPAVRNMATVGGNLFAPYPYGDFAVALLALGAEVLSEGADGPQTVGLETFLAGREAMKPSVVRSVVFALPPHGSLPLRQGRPPEAARGLGPVDRGVAARGEAEGDRCARRLWRDGADGRSARTRVEAALEGRPLDAACDRRGGRGRRRRLRARRAIPRPAPGTGGPCCRSISQRLLSDC